MELSNLIYKEDLNNGATGPTGPSATTSSLLIGNDGRQTVGASGNLNLGSIINSTGASVTFAAPSTITLQDPGTYLIIFSSLISNTLTAGDVGATLEVNGTEVPNASQYISATSNETQMILQHSLTITTPTTITVTNNSSVSNNYHDTSVSILKIA